VRFSLDETFDVGADTGTAVVEDYADKMPFSYQGKLNRFTVVLQPEKLDEKEKQRLLEQIAQASAAVH
jgi:arylsulfatase